MPGKPAGEIPWSIIYTVLQDDSIEPVRKARAAREAAADEGRSDRSGVMFDRYMAAAWVVQNYHMGGPFDLRRIDQRTWLQLEGQLRRDLAQTDGGSIRLHLGFEALMERITPRMVERAVAGWYAAQETPAAPAVAAVAGEARGRALRSRLTAVALPLAVSVVFAAIWWLPSAPQRATAPRSQPQPQRQPVREDVVLAPVHVTPGRPAEITVELVSPDYTGAEAVKLQLNMFEVPVGVTSQDLITGSGVTFLFDRTGYPGLPGLQKQAIYRLTRRVVDGRTFVTFTLNLPAEPGVIDYILNAGPEEQTHLHQTGLPVGPRRSDGSGS